MVVDPGKRQGNCALYAKNREKSDAVAARFAEYCMELRSLNSHWLDVASSDDVVLMLMFLLAYCRSEPDLMLPPDIS